MRFLAYLLALTAVPTFAAAHDYKIGDLMIEHPAAKTTPSTAMAGAGYLTIMNMGETADTLIAVRADYPRVEIHDTKVEDDVATMFKVDGIEIAPGESVTFMPGGKHIMFMGLDGDPFEEGEEIAGTLVFENAGELEVVFNVETLDEIMERVGGMEHGSDGHGTHNH